MQRTDLLQNPVAAEPTFAAFAVNRLIAAGPREKVLRASKKHIDKGGPHPLIFEELSGRQVDFDFRGSIDDVLTRVSETAKAGPGRPRLGVVSREVSLLPRHWDWLESQPNGASAAIRRLVDEARHNETGIERGRHVRNGINKLLWAVAGDFANFEEVARALDAREDTRLDGLMSSWPKDLRDYVFRRVDLAKEIEGW
jgi:uncharacterized protein